MIRPLEPEDTDTVLEIWLRSSVAAHDFVPRSYWEGKLDEMRTRYLPDSRTFVYQDESAESVCGFVSLVENYVAALFVHPDPGRDKVSDAACCNGPQRNIRRWN